MLALELLWLEISHNCLGGPVMWMERLLRGVLRVLTPLGPRYLYPSFPQRLYLLWIFRNFQTLPAKVLSSRQQQRIDAMCAEHGFVALAEPHGFVDIPILGTLEQRPEIETAASRRHPATVAETVAPFAADQHGS